MVSLLVSGSVFWPGCRLRLGEWSPRAMSHDLGIIMSLICRVVLRYRASKLSHLNAAKTKKAGRFSVYQNDKTPKRMYDVTIKLPNKQHVYDANSFWSKMSVRTLVDMYGGVPNVGGGSRAAHRPPPPPGLVRQNDWSWWSLIVSTCGDDCSSTSS